MLSIRQIFAARMTEELSGVTVVIIIGLGALTIVLLFIFAKRQIMRFALRNRGGPHIPIGHSARKYLKREIDRRIELIPRILSEPQLMDDDPRFIVAPGQQIPVHYYRFKAVDMVKLLEKEIRQHDAFLSRRPHENLRAYLLTTLAAALNGSGQRLIHQFCDLYEHARHDPSFFGEEEYKSYHRLYLKLMDAAKLLKTNNSRKTSPNRTPQKQRLNQEKNRNLLDPSRLKPLPGLLIEESLCASERNERSANLILPLSDNETSV